MDECVQDFYTIKEAAYLLGVTYDTMRQRVARGKFPGLARNGRLFGIRKRDFWATCEQWEQVGKIRVRWMPDQYKDERRKYIIGVSYENNVLWGKGSKKKR